MQILHSLRLEQPSLTIATPSLRESLDDTTATTAAMARAPFLANLSLHQQKQQQQQQQQLNRRGA